MKPVSRCARTLIGVLRMPPLVWAKYRFFRLRELAECEDSDFLCAEVDRVYFFYV